MELNKKNIRKILLIITFAVFLFAIIQNIPAVYSGVLTVAGVFSPITVGLCIAFVLNIPLRFLERHLFSFMKRSKRKFVRRLCRPLSLLLTLVLSLGIIAFLLFILLPQIYDTLYSLFDSLPSFMNTASDWITAKLAEFNIASGALELNINWTQAFNIIKEYLQNYSSDIFGGAVNITTSIIGGTFNTIFSIIIALYVLAQKETIGIYTRKILDCFLPEKLNARVYHVAHITNESFANFISGQLTEAVILATLCFIGMSIFRFPYAGVISLFMCVSALVPIVGAFAGATVGAFLILMVNPIQAMFFLMFILILQQIETNFIYPRVVGGSVGLPGIIVLSAVIVGGNVAGVAGALCGVPISAVLFVLLKEAIESKKTDNIPKADIKASK